ncbi:transporter [Psychrosphaera saromensis]|uniref:Sodium/alanine symporter n=1 Tax=Psychrosphaera saromensis TaxID=716813 RepID=A0A2S7URM5_9GAMM|nr:amino acid carrier protein [Psychrosphaera saromensis]PQJ52395.1 sodium/alanine symporter [Psychrosphaera saromensis]GHB73409.1 transporter [Psychrosphaera saromensis]GLQ13437.1 transporter [Psychrosphaera saromensis]
MDWLGSIMTAFSNFVWGMPMIVLLVGGGIFFTVYSRLTPFRYIGHGISLLTGKHDKDSEKGQLTHAQALSAALAGTVGMGNISGVALAITAGGPGAVFWMWLTALLGISTKFFTCSLGVMFRKTDKDGEVHGGPMYVITEGLGKKWKPLAVLFAFAGLWGTIPSFQANQLTAALREELIPKSWFSSPDMFNLVVAIVITLLVAGVIMGGLKRVAYVTTRLVPSMAIMYVLMTLAVLFNHLPEIPQLFQSIFVEAFQPQAVSGGILGVLIIGVSRGVFSNEAGIGTEVLAHGAVKTNEPIREGLVGMLGPIVDTLIMCTCTALVILASGMWQDVEGVKGVELTMQVFGQELGVIGQVLLAIQILFLAASTMFTYWYYGEKCFVYLLGEANRKYYKPFYLTTIMIGCLVTLDIIFNFMIGMYGLMAIPTMLSAILLAPKVKAAAKVYFAKL